LLHKDLRIQGLGGLDIAQQSTLGSDAYVWGWDPLPGIVSVWAGRDGQAIVWQRQGQSVVSTRTRYRPWLFAAGLDDLAHVGGALAPAGGPDDEHQGITCCELEGDAAGYRYLLSARSWNMLEHTLVAGARRRLGRAITSLYDVEDDYYWVGPVEQYLMWSGRAYFRGLVYDDLHRLQFDLETTALDPQRGRIFMVAVRDSQGLTTTLRAATAEQEPALIAGLVSLIQQRNPDIIENHNLFGFDLPFLEERARVHGISLRLGRAEAPHVTEHYGNPRARGARRRERMRLSVPGREMIDTLDAVLRYAWGAEELPSYRLKDVARYFGVAAPERVYLAGSEVFATFRDDPERVAQYALDDVAEVDALSRRLMGAPFALASMAPRRYERLASAGPAMGILEPMLVRAYLHARAALPRQATGDGQGMHSGASLELFAAGIAEHVVKADIASLYPSLMRIYGIGPACDRRGVLLSIVDRLTDLRLHHKAAAREATPGSLDARHHDATQTAMKVLINSAYGYMGAGSMALFADARAADEVTRRGREVLAQVVAALREQGMALIEADTDGVYFGVPAGWTEAQERTLVADVAAILPDGIRLEYEGRYRAMFSHEVKNYVLLTYGDDLILRGVAFRSSRAEPFGIRFLRAALRCTLLGNTAGVHAAFLDSVTALRERTLPVEDVAARVRLTKTPEIYQARRAQLQEGQYEALLAAGRSDWAVGERVRCYRAQGGRFVWLPDETEDLSDGHTWESQPEEQAQPPYDVEHYLHVLVTSYASRLRKAFAPEVWEQLFRLDQQTGLFDLPVDEMEPLWIRVR
jgi:DNA polymerase, archaea type